MESLGDGVTADYDGFHVVLTADGSKTIYLEPSVLAGLLRYAVTSTERGGAGLDPVWIKEVVDAAARA